MSHRAFLIELLLLAAGLARAQAQPPYYLDDLGNFGSASSYGCAATGINAQGQVVGYAIEPGTGRVAVRFAPAGPVSLGMYAGLRCRADINDQGLIVATRETGELYRYAYLYRDGGWVDLGTLDGLNNTAAAINNAGVVVGTVELRLVWGGDVEPQSASPPAPAPGSGYVLAPLDTNGDSQPDLWYRDLNQDGDNDLMLRLNTLGGTTSWASGINDSGLICGTAQTAEGLMAACLYTQQGMVRIVPGNDCDSYAHGISGNGTVVGYTLQEGLPLFRFRDANGNGQSDPGELTLQPSQGETSWVRPHAINDGGEAVGVRLSPDSPHYTAVLWSGSEILDLNALVAPGSGLRLLEALDINEAGHIVGRAEAADGSGRAFLLTPATGGDANLDRAVDVGDLGILAGNWGQSGKSWAEADFTGEGDVNVSDLGVLAGNWGWMRPTSPGMTADPGSTAIPEPLTLLSMALGLAGLARRRR